MAKFAMKCNSQYLLWNGVIYSINESFLGPGCGNAGGMEGSNEDGKQPRIKRREKQTKGGENVVYSGLSNRTKRRRPEESLSVDGVSVTIFTGNGQNDRNPLTFGSVEIRLQPSQSGMSGKYG